jgi:hypothetical protein
MKKLFFALFVMSLAGTSYGQFTMGSSYIPADGDYFVNRSCDTTGLAPGGSGSDQNWNYSSLALLSDSARIDYVLPAATPYSSSFPTSTIASVSGSSYTYLRLLGNQLLNLGHADQLSLIVLTDAQVIFQYPFTFGNNFSDIFIGSYTLASVNFNRSGMIDVSADAFGSIVLPTGTFSNTLRIKTVVDMTDSSTSGVPIVVRTKTTIYSWYSSTLKFPVFQIIINEITTLGNTIITKSGLVSILQTLGLNQISSQVPEKFSLSQNYPNPFNPETIIRIDVPRMSNVKLKVFDIAGRELSILVNENLGPGIYEYNWNASGFSSGAYFYRMETDGIVHQTRKMMLLK